MPLIDYSDDETTLEGYLAHECRDNESLPCMLIAHAWDGLGSHTRALADAYAKKGFVAFALDAYGKGKRGAIDGDNSHLMNPLMADRRLLLRRLMAALRFVQNLPEAQPNKIFILGHCFGGLCALDLARAAPDGLIGAIAIHASLLPPRVDEQPRITASVIALHGWEDPIAPRQDLLNFATEMTNAGADWQLHAYGHAMHAFTFVGADIPKLGIKYDANAHRRSSLAIDNFVDELLARGGDGV